MRTFLAFARAAFQQQLAYRVANWAGLFTNVFFLFMRAHVIDACYAARATIGGMSAAESVAYVTITQALVMVTPQWGRVGLADTVRSGQIAVAMLRPVDFFGMTIAGRLGVSAYYVVARMLPMLTVGAVAGLLVAPAGLVSLLAFALSVALGAWVATSILFLIELSSFWLESDRGVRYVVSSVAMLPSGLILPLSWFPEPLQLVFRLTPFPYAMHLPTAIWLGEVQGAELVAGIGVQAGWVVALTALARWAFARGTRRLQVVGG